jgi:AraC-like DNA-binding protein
MDALQQRSYRLHMSTSDPRRACRIVEDVLDTRVAITQRRGVMRIAVSEVKTADLSVIELVTSGHVDCDIVCGERFTVETVVGGTLQVHGAARPYERGDVLVAGRPRVGYHCRINDLRLIVIAMPMSLVRSVSSRPSVRFTSIYPRNEYARAQWARTVGYVSQLLTGPGGTRPVIAQAARLLAATALAVFPHTDTAVDQARRESAPQVVSRAVAFIETNAATDISLADVANHVHLSPRAVQYVFRRHLRTTPMRYLRRVRLHRAHRDLLAGHAAAVTVADVARRCGFGHVGRFAAAYQREFQETPAVTLRRVDTHEHLFS